MEMEVTWEGKAFMKGNDTSGAKRGCYSAGCCWVKVRDGSPLLARIWRDQAVVEASGRWFKEVTRRNHGGVREVTSMWTRGVGGGAGDSANILKEQTFWTLKIEEADYTWLYRETSRQQKKAESPSQSRCGLPV